MGRRLVLGMLAVAGMLVVAVPVSAEPGGSGPNGLCTGPVSIQWSDTHLDFRRSQAGHSNWYVRAVRTVTNKQACAGRSETLVLFNHNRAPLFQGIAVLDSRGNGNFAVTDARVQDVEAVEVDVGGTTSVLPFGRGATGVLPFTGDRLVGPIILACLLIVLGTGLVRRSRR